jgi:acyl-CoA-binding protein
MRAFRRAKFDAWRAIKGTARQDFDVAVIGLVNCLRHQ